MQVRAFTEEQKSESAVGESAVEIWVLQKRFAIMWECQALYIGVLGGTWK